MIEIGENQLLYMKGAWYYEYLFSIALPTLCSERY